MEYLVCVGVIGKLLLLKKKSKNKTDKNSKITKGSSRAIDKYFDETKKNTRIRRMGYITKMAGSSLTNSARNQYNETIGRTVSVNTRNAIQGKAIAGKVLNSIGNITITGSLIKQYRDYKKYW